MTPATLNTILNSAPMIIQGAGKLIDLIRDRTDEGTPTEEGASPTVESLKVDIDGLEKRLANIDESNIEQIKLIEQLARQNEALAESLATSNTRFSLAFIISIIALVIALLVLILLLIK